MQPRKARQKNWFYDLMIWETYLQLTNGTGGKTQHDNLKAILNFLNKVAQKFFWTAPWSTHPPPNPDPPWLCYWGENTMVQIPCRCMFMRAIHQNPCHYWVIFWNIFVYTHYPGYIHLVCFHVGFITRLIPTVTERPRDVANGSYRLSTAS